MSSPAQPPQGPPQGPLAAQIQQQQQQQPPLPPSSSQQAPPPPQAPPGLANPPLMPLAMPANPHAMGHPHQFPIRGGPPSQQRQQHQQSRQQQQHQHQQQPPHQEDEEDDGGVPQLPPQMFTTAAQLLDLTDKKLVLVLRDGRKLVGILRSWDQFANLVLQDTVEKVYAGNLFAEQKRGIYIVRGENVLLLGEIDLDKEDELPPNYQPGEWEHVCALKEAEDAERKKLNNNRGKQLHTLGFEAEHSGEALF